MFSFKGMKITYKLLFLFVLWGVVPFVAIGIFSYTRGKDALLDRTFEQLTSVRVVKKRQLTDFFSDRKRDAMMIARSDYCRSFFDENPKFSPKESVIGSPVSSVHALMKESYLNSYLISCGYYNRIIFYAGGSDVRFSNIGKQQDSMITELSDTSSFHDIPAILEL
ncbi:MAG: hypothetical protein KKA07_05570, partial [Bacteroidetes bacterium]|nr:hypothetical protein [Bacteroidota bacterium]